MKRTYIITLLLSLCSLFTYAQDSFFDKNGYEELMRINDEGEKTIIYLKRNKNKEKEFVLMSQEKNEFTIIAITGNLTLQEIQGIINKE